MVTTAYTSIGANFLIIKSQANDAAVAISAGANHVMLVHRSGQLYTWGVGASGRLGLDLSQGGNPQAGAVAALYQGLSDNDGYISWNTCCKHEANIKLVGHAEPRHSSTTENSVEGSPSRGSCTPPNLPKLVYAQRVVAFIRTTRVFASEFLVK